MFNWRQYPLIRFTLPFIAGILYGVYAQTSSQMWLFVALACILLLVAFKLTRLTASYRWNWINGVCANFSLFSVAVFLVIWNTPSFQDDFYANNDHEWIIAKVKSPLVEKAKTYQAKLEVQGVFSHGELKEASGIFLAYLEKGEVSEQLPYGQLIAVRIDLSPIEGPKNPGQFDYQEYMRFHGIYESGYVPANQLIDLKLNEGFYLMEVAQRLRRRFLTILQSSGLEEGQFPVASALILGQREFLDPDTIRSYSSAGAMHVLAVSGLHVGIIFMVLNFLLSFLDKRKKGKVLKACI